MEKFITDEHTGLTNWSEIIIWLPVMKNRSWNQSASTVSAIGAIYRCNGSQRFRVHVSALHLHFCLSKAYFLHREHTVSHCMFSTYGLVQRRDIWYTQLSRSKGKQ